MDDLRPLFENCQDGPCPKVYRGVGGVLVQGPEVSDSAVLARMRPGSGEVVNFIPDEALLEAARRLLEERQ